MSLTNKQIIILLNLPGIGRKTAFKICDLATLKDNMSDQDLFEFISEIKAKKQVNRMPFITSNDFKKARGKADEIMVISEKMKIGICSFFDQEFPEKLKDSIDPPIILNYKGDIKQINEKPGIAIIGTRQPTMEGVEDADFFGEYLAEKGYNIVSGLAKGCDTSAHKGCLQAGGLTTAVVAHGLHMVYPAENSSLAEKIISKGGVIISEYFFGTEPKPNYFAKRDRIQAGLSEALIVIQADLKSGTMHTVNFGLKNNRLLAAAEYANLSNSIIEGNKMLIESGNAFRLTRSNIDEFLNLIFLKE